MAGDFLFNTAADFLKNQAKNFVAHLLSSAPGSPTQGQIYYNTTDKTFEFYNGTSFVKLGTLDQITPPVNDVNMNSRKLVSLADGTSGNDAVNKSQLDAAIAGIKWKAGVRAATTAAGTLASSFENGDSVDGVTLATGDRILIKDQAAATENGIYTVNATGAPTRATDADTGAEMLNAAVFVAEGTTNADTGWVCTTNATITLGSTNVAFAQFTGGSITAGTGASMSGSTLNVGAGATKGSGGPGGGLKANADDLVVDFDVVVGKFNANIGNGSSTTIDTTHSLGTKDCTATFRDNSTDEELHPAVSYPDTNTIRSIWSSAPSTNGVRVCVKA